MYELENDDEIEIDLRELFLALKKKIVWILLTAIVFAGASGLITKFAMTPIYSSTAQLYVVSKGGLSQLTDLTMGTQLTQDYMVIVKTRPVLEQVIADLKLDMDYKELEKKITVENPSDTRIMQITITDKDAALAQSITQDLAEVTAKTVAEKMDVKSPTIIEKAYKADKPDSPSLKKNVLIGAVLGFILMAAAIVIQYLMNDTILKEEDIEKYLGIITLAQLPLVKGTTKRTKKVKRARNKMKKLVMDLPEINDYRMVEGLNQLKTNLAFCGKDIKVITMTSSVPNEGKSSISLSLSRTLAESGKKILMVDADLRKSVMAARYHIQGIDKGLSHYLTGQAEVEDIIYETEVEGLCITVAGPLSPDPTSILDSEQFEQFIEKVRDMFDYVIIDTPPLGVVIDAVIIGKYTDGAVIVIEQGVIKRKIVQDVIKQLKRGEVRIFGAVLNKVDERIGAYGNYEYKYSYSYYGESDTEKKSPKYLIRRNVSMSNKIIKKAAACGLSAVMAFGLVAVTEAPKTANVSAATKKVKKLSFKKKGYVISAPGHWMNAKTRLKFSPKSAKTYKLKYKTSNKKDCYYF